MFRTRPQRDATARSCVTSTSVVCDCELRSNSSEMMLFTGVGVEIPCRLVREQHGGPRDEGACDRHALLLAAGELPRIVAGAVFEAHAGERFPCGIARVAPAGELERQHDVFQRRQRGHQVKRLEHEAHAFGTQAGPAVFIERRQVGAREGYASGSRRIEPGQQRQQCRFACA